MTPASESLEAIEDTIAVLLLQAWLYEGAVESEISEIVSGVIDERQTFKSTRQKMTSVTCLGSARSIPLFLPHITLSLHPLLCIADPSCRSGSRGSHVSPEHMIAYISSGRVIAFVVVIYFTCLQGLDFVSTACL